ncbi:LacI family transcriptional regulator [Streptococcus azizii]|uniref:D-galactose/methyl-galactoside binding periplasmic protein MglB n=1 Tax=Streptococcus azizii TaxID=1579424 RepID=A0AB36JL61_9STRE|nr:MULTISPECIES: galactose ABC transporter substrate-binding protein [Streptococcus]MBF0776575.1 galactose ABC transporter substrate-binding protein [Streptococcus sp. 19428wD3_AN2]ONK26474.1 LacI family transcriptional regulator [Streptococcus azizii]ONK26501.1 LacI family transcriptional regulator [Streptococcus azizii]ONK27001.1 LacI family transcriptional regulator [Streptococcus azizii]TFU82794.1 LacI family transcriptional regulator [Streptococcus sp. AN2]
MKSLKYLVVAFLAIFLVACGAKGGDSGSGKTYNVGVAIYKFDDNFMTLYREELENYFGELSKKTGDKYVLDIQDGKQDQATQTEQINNFIAQGKDVILANLVDPTAAGSIINSAKSANIPVVLINREPEVSELEIWPGKTSYVGADATQSGTFQGEIIAATDSKGDLNGDGVVNYITLFGDPANVDAQQRTTYSVKALEDAGIKKAALAEPYLANWDTAKGQEVTASALEQFGDKLEVVFANNDGMAVGAVTAIKAAKRTVGKDILVVGVDAIPDAMELLAKGELTGTVLNDHFNQSHTAANVAVKLMNGEDVESYYWVDYVKVTKKEDSELKEAEPRTETTKEAKERYAKRDK